MLILICLNFSIEAQNIFNVSRLCDRAMLAIDRNDYLSAKYQYDSLITAIQDQVHNGERLTLHKFPIELPEYIIDNLLRQNSDHVIKYVSDILDIYRELSYNGIDAQILDHYKSHISYLLSQLDVNTQVHYIEEITNVLLNNDYVDLVIPFYLSQIRRLNEYSELAAVEKIEFLSSAHAGEYGYIDEYKKFSSKVFDDIVYNKGAATYISKNIHLAHLTRLLHHLFYYSDEEYSSKETISRCISSIHNILDNHFAELSKDSLIETFYSLSSYYCNISLFVEAEYYINKAIELLNKSDVESCIETYLTKAQICVHTGNIGSAQEILAEIYKYRTQKEELWDHSFILYYLRQCAVELDDADELYEYTKLWYGYCLKDYLSCSWSMRKNIRMNLWYHCHGNQLYYALNKLGRTAFLSDSLSCFTYNVALIQKGFSNQYDDIIRNNVYNSGDNELILSYNRYNEALIRNTDTSLYEAEFQNNYLKHDEFINSFSFMSWKDVQSKLESDEVAIEFAEIYPGLDSTNCSTIFVDDGAYYIALLLKQFGTPIPIKLCTSDEIQRFVKKGHILYRQPHCIEAYSEIWGKIHPYLKGINTIYFSPHSDLCNINIEFLADETEKLFCDKYKVIRLSSTSEISTILNQNKINTATLFGGLIYDDSLNPPQSIKTKKNRHIYRSSWTYLDGTLSEIQNISEILKNVEVTTFSGQLGTEQQFKTLSVTNPDILHIASHGFYFSENEVHNIPFFYNKNPGKTDYVPAMKRSGLLLSGGQKAWDGINYNADNDGILTSEEISGMYLNKTQLVVLSACQTGIGLNTTEGVVGLQKAFKLAGVQTIVMSLWEVDDRATEIMMTNFYKFLSKGDDKHVAFEKAVEKVRKWNNNPYYWAAFIMLD